MAGLIAMNESLLSEAPDPARSPRPDDEAGSASSLATLPRTKRAEPTLERCGLRIAGRLLVCGSSAGPKEVSLGGVERAEGTR